MPKAIQVREDNLDYIMEYARARDLDVSSYLKDNMEYNAEDGFKTYMVTDGDKTHDRNNTTFTMFTEEGFRDYWKFKQQENPNQFVEIERV